MLDAKTYLKISTINLVFLFAGILIGISYMDGKVSVHAQGTKDVATTKVERTLDPNFEYVTPTITAGVAGFNQVLAHQIAADQLMIQGIDILRLDENILNLLRAKGVSLAETQKAVDEAKVAKPLRLRP